MIIPRNKKLPLYVFAFLSSIFLIFKFDILCLRHHSQSVQVQSNEISKVKPVVKGVQDPSLLEIPANQKLFDKSRNKLLRTSNKINNFQHIDIAIIFRHGSAKTLLQNNLQIAVKSMLQHTSTRLCLHVVTDDQSFHMAQKIIASVISELHLQSAILQVCMLMLCQFNFS